MSDRPRVPGVLITTQLVSDGFMKDDIRILKRFARVVTFETSDREGIGGPGAVQAVRVLWRFVWVLVAQHIDAVIFWFVSMPFDPLMALIARLLGRKVLLITGGSDSLYIPEIDWGGMKRRSHRFGYRFTIRFAHSILPFSHSAAAVIAASSRPAHMRTIYPAIDTAFFEPGDGAIESRIVTCCYALSDRNIVQKGIDVLVEVARRLPDVRFVVTGDGSSDAAVKELRDNAPPNIQFLPRIPSKAAYRDFLQGSAVYAQLSAYEGFGVSLAEAMATGCIPIVSDRGSLPEVVGDCGFVVPYHDVDATVAAVRKAVELGGSLESASRKGARERTVGLFEEGIRARLLHEELARLVPSMA